MQNSDWNAFIDTLDAEPRRILTTAAEHFSDIAAKFGSRILEKQEQIDGKLDQVLAEVRAFGARVGALELRVGAVEQRLDALEQRERASGEA